jgi:hypothetical protein
MPRPSPLARVCVAALTALLVLGARPGPAAAALDFVPFTGLVVPSNSMVLDHETPIIIQQSDTAILGAQLAWRTGSRITPELSVGYGRGNIDLIGGSAVQSSAAMLLADLRARIALTRPDAAVGFALIAGVGLQHLNGSLFQFFEDSNSGIKLETRPAGIVGLGTDIRAGGTARLRIDLVDRFHRTELEADPTLAPTIPDKNTEHDIVMTIGLALPLGS